jgi:hypothetical protein
MIVINFFGGPNSGKSTQAAGLFHKMKLEGCSVEHVNEYAKMCVWENRMELLEDQLYVMAKQNRRVKRLEGKVGFAVTDSPILLSSIYRSAYGEPHYSDLIDKLSHECFNNNHNINFMCKRDTQGYTRNQRSVDYEKALELDEAIYVMFRDYKIPFFHLDINENSIDVAYKYVMKRMEKGNL